MGKCVLVGVRDEIGEKGNKKRTELGNWGGLFFVWGRVGDVNEDEKNFLKKFLKNFKNKKLKSVWNTTSCALL